VTANNKASILNVLFGVASLFIPLVYRFGQLAQAGMLARISRDDENEADKYGPDADVAGWLRSRRDAHVHGTSRCGRARESRRGLQSISPTIPGRPSGWRISTATPSSIPPCAPTTSASRKGSTTSIPRAYNIAAMKFTDILKRRPEDSTARFQLGQAQLALGQVSKGEQNLAAAARKSRRRPRRWPTCGSRPCATRNAGLNLLHPDLSPLRDQLATAPDRPDPGRHRDRATPPARSRSAQVAARAHPRHRVRDPRLSRACSRARTRGSTPCCTTST